MGGGVGVGGGLPYYPPRLSLLAQSRGIVGLRGGGGLLFGSRGMGGRPSGGSLGERAWGIGGVGGAPVYMQGGRDGTVSGPTVSGSGAHMGVGGGGAYANAHPGLGPGALSGFGGMRAVPRSLPPPARPFVPLVLRAKPVPVEKKKEVTDPEVHKMLALRTLLMDYHLNMALLFPLGAT